MTLDDKCQILVKTLQIKLEVFNHIIIDLDNINYGGG